MTEENAMAPLPWGREVIEGILPHRDQFVWVSRIMAIAPSAPPSPCFRRPSCAGASAFSPA